MTDQLQEAYVVVRYSEDRDAECIASAVSPDNLVPGKDLIVNTWSIKREVHCVVKCKRGLRSLISTLDDFLFSIKVAENTLLSIRKDA